MAGAILTGFAVMSGDFVILPFVFAAIASPLSLGLGILGIALGAAFFGSAYDTDFRDALKVAAVVVPLIGALAALAIALLVTSSSLVVVVAPLIAIGVMSISVPLLVQARKPEVEPSSGGLTFAF